ncbi:MAG: TrkA C-terminal domain-containing protein, partial [Verrucomicrobiota bacterium]
DPIILADNSKWAGEMVKDIDLRRETGALIAGIERSGFEIASIDPTTRLYPHDHIFILGEPDQINKASIYLNQKTDTLNATPETFSFAREIVPPLCQWNGQRIMDTEMRSKYGVTIVGIQKGEERVIGPLPQTVIEEGDLILLMGIQENLDLIHELLSCQDEHEVAERTSA